MEPHGHQGLPKHQTFSIELTTETVLSLQLVIQELSSPHQMEPRGLQELQEHLKIYQVLLTETDFS